MKKIYLVKTTQFNKVFYTGSVDACKLARMVDQSIEVDTLQEAQRPLEKGHLMAISRYIGEEHGILPTSIIVGTKNKDKLTLETEYAPNGNTLYYMMFPDTEDELKNYENTIDVADGQHRVFSFIDKYRNVKLKDSDNYELPITIFITPTIPEQQKIFLTVNAKQKAVAPNLLAWLEYKLGMSSNEDTLYMQLVEKLNTENISPIKGRITMSAEKLKNGYKSKKLVQDFNHIKLKETIGALTSAVTVDFMLKVISVYLQGWEKYFNFTFASNDGTTQNKILALDYMLELLPTFLTISLNNGQNFTVEFVADLLSELEEAMDVDKVVGETLFTTKNAFEAFRSTTLLRFYVDDSKNKLIEHNRVKKNQFNPLLSIQ